MEIYLLKSAACLAIFFAFYKLFMERESFHVTKRFYLLAGLIASFLIPLVTFTSYVEVVPVRETVSFIEGVVAIPSETGWRAMTAPMLPMAMYILPGASRT